MGLLRAPRCGAEPCAHGIRRSKGARYRVAGPYGAPAPRRRALPLSYGAIGTIRQPLFSNTLARLPSRRLRWSAALAIALRIARH